MIYITITPFNNKKYQTVSDFQKTVPPLNNTLIYFIFIDGKITIPFYRKMLQYQFKRLIIYVQNAELFYINFCVPFNLKYFYLTVKHRTSEYQKVEKLIRKEGLDNTEKLSFDPRIFDSIRTSLMRPDLYLSEDNAASLLFKRVMEEKVATDDVEDVESLNSLIYAGILIEKNGYLYVNDLLL